MRLMNLLIDDIFSFLFDMLQRFMKADKIEEKIMGI